MEPAEGMSSAGEVLKTQGSVDEDWEGEERARRPAATGFTVDIGGYEGPLDALLALAKAQQVDLSRISMIELADAYIEFVQRAEALRIDLAADYLIMASELALLKSKLLCRKAMKSLENEADDEARLIEEALKARQRQLERLDRIQKLAEFMMARPRLGIDVFGRGEAEGPGAPKSTVPAINLLDLIRAYIALSERTIAAQPLAVRKAIVIALAEGLKVLRSVLASQMGWQELFSVVPEKWRTSPEMTRAGIAATFVASLEMGKRGEVLIRQTEQFGLIEIRRCDKGQRQGQ